MRTIARALAAGVLCTLAPPVKAGKLDKAFEALQVHNYFLAREILLGQVKKHPAAAWYGLSVITGRADNPFYQLDSSFFAIQRADAAFTTTDDRERVRIKKLGVDDDAIRAQRKHVNDVAWDQTRGLNTIAAYERYLNTYQQSAHLEAARTVRDSMAFEVARAANTAAAYQAFIDRYPEAHGIFQARARLQEAIYREATPDRTIPQYEAFLARYPDSPFTQNAEDEIYRLSTTARTASAFRDFISKYPTNHRVPEAWRALYEIHTKDLNVGTITQFLRDHPDYPYINELSADYTVANLRLYAIRRDGKWGYMDEDGLERIKAEYDEAEPFRNGQALVGREERTGTINKGGREVVPILYDDVLEFSEGLATVERGGKVGAVERSGELSVPMEFTEVGEFKNGLAYAEREEKYGYIDARGGERIGFVYDMAGTFRNGLAVVEKEDRVGAIDAKGDVVVPFQYDWIEGFEQGPSRVRNGDHMGIIGPFGDVLLAVEHEHVGAFKDGLALVIDGRKCGYVDMTGRWVVPQQYEAPEGAATWGDFFNGCAEVQKAGKRGMIDTKGALLFPCQWQDIGRVTGPLVPVKKKDRWSYVDRKMAPVGKVQADQAWEPVSGHARFRIGDRFAMIDSTGRTVLPAHYSAMSDVQFGKVVVENEGATGIVDLANGVVLPLAYDAVSIVDEHMARVTRGERIAWYRTDRKAFVWKEQGFDAE